MISTPWSAAVLCGGRSRRMGRDKALLAVDGEPMARRVVWAAGQAGAIRVVTVGGDLAGIAAALRGLDVEHAVLPDDETGQGPLGGIITALGALDTDVVLVVACDLVTPSADAMGAIVAALVDTPTADLAAPQRDDQVEWLHAAWRRPVRPRLAARFAAGERSIHGAVASAQLTVRTVPDLAPSALADADTPDELRRPSPGSARGVRGPGN